MTGTPPRSRTTARIARIELRRSLRKVRANGTLLAVFGLNALLFGAFVVAFAALAWGLGRTLASVLGRTIPVVPAARGGAGILAVSLATFTMMRAVGRGGTVDSLDGLLVTVPVADVAGGVLLAEAGRLLVFLVPPAALIGGTFAVAVGAPTMALTLPLALAAIVLFAVPTGFALGLGGRVVLTRFEPIANHRTVVGALLLTAWMAFALSGGINVAGAALFDPLARTPLGWVADLLLLGVPHVAAAPVNAAAAGGAAVAVGAVGVVASTRLSASVWLTDPPGDADEDAAASGTRLFDGDLVGRLPTPVSRTSRAVATTVWLRARRAPIELSYVLYPVFFGVYAIQDVVQRGYVPAYAPGAVLTYAAWGVGAAVTLNPLGAQGPTLPGVLTSRLDGRAYLRGHLLVAGVVGVPIATALTVGTAVAAPLSISEVALLAVLTPLCALAAAGLACGFGVLFPRFGSVRVTSNREAVVPSKTAGILYSLALLLLLSLAGVGIEPGARGAVADALGVPGVAVVVVALAPLVACSYLSYRYAAGRIGAYRLE